MKKDQGYYIGSSADVFKRLIFHNKGLQRSTKSRIPFKLIYSEELADKSAALQRERQIKNYKGGEGFKKLLKEM